MKHLCLTLIALAALAASAVAQDFDQVRAEADKMFQQTDHEVASLDSARQAAFRLLVLNHLASLEVDLRVADKDSARVARLMDIVHRFTDPLLADSTADPSVKAKSLREFMAGTRQRLGLPAAITDSAVTSADTSKSDGSPVAVSTLLVVPGPSVPVADIFAAREAANWSANLKAAPKDLAKRLGQVWASEDGLVTFAVGQGQSRLVDLARRKAEVDAGVVMARRGQESGVTVAPASGVSSVRYEHRDDHVYCLVAIPTVLLPK